MAANVPLPTPPALAHSLLLLSEYTHSLDALPLDLSRQFADLRELDAVLSSSAQNVTQKIYELVDLIENGEVPKEARLKRLGQIMEEMQRLKHGGEDKIRVATQAADNLVSHKAHLTTLLTAASTYDPTFTPSLLYQRTTYPHLPPPRPQDALPIESGRRRRTATTNAMRGQLVGGLLTAETVSPAKSRKRLREDEETVPTPRKEREGTTAGAGRRGGSTGSKGRKLEQAAAQSTHRGNSPSADSVLSVTSHPVAASRAAAAAAAAATTAVVPPPTVAASRTSVQAEVASVADEADHPDADEGDGRTYCYCQGPSYGEMVGCDDEQCAFEWFHLTCVGLTSAPKAGTWYCDDCKAKRAGSKKSRGGKRRGGASNASTGSGVKAGRGRA
ncbi:hypothetical protein M422DRAFT_68543 [Sphaerobolus stellatus SS14]|uniref:Chromatin modification-related protein n=1 Tax=Sphaerobolus stellatus (strain SS14) TaxID=990650 RepID=A0A0C9VG90_SPHS4|nr:hypothetical protein M422DRAFT_68543 [Sphaerobolus stellatus SS14]